MASGGLRILLVEDDSLEGRLLQRSLSRHRSVQVDLVRTGEAALERFARTPFDAVVTDLVMPGMNGIELVRRVRHQDTSLPLIVFTAHAGVERAVEAIRAGATDFVVKPVNPEAMLALVERAVAERPLREEVTDLRGRRGAIPDARLCGDHPRLASVRDLARRIAAVPNTRVLITGESGTGKSMLARIIHELSGVPGRYVELSCAALPAQLLESELFGHERGAFTDAKSLKRGLIELADNGTLFLDEIGAMPLELQAKLLLFLGTREVRRVGSTHWFGVRTRVIAATNDDLRERVREGAFRADLLYRLDVASIEMPPLRLMPEIIPELVDSFVRELCREVNRPVPQVTPITFAALLCYSWPGNVRELRNAVERALIFHEQGPLIIRAPTNPGPPPETAAMFSAPFGVALDELERLYLSAMLERNPLMDYSELAARLGISRKTLWEKRRLYAR